MKNEQKTTPTHYDDTRPEDSLELTYLHWNFPVNFDNFHWRPPSLGSSNTEQSEEEREVSGSHFVLI